jgi:hypothetical protein
MSDGIDKLKRDYQAIRAPDYLATRIRAETRDNERKRRTWLPAMATVAVAVAAVTVAPVLLQQQASDQNAAPRPTSMSSLSGVSSSKPPMTAPSLTRLKSVTIPALPKKPRPTTEKEPQSHFDTETEPMKEKHHAYS